MCEMDVQLPPPSDDGTVRKGPYGYVTLGNSEFVYARRAVLTSLTTSVSDFETVVFTLISYKIYSGGDALLANARQEVKDLWDLVNKERRCEHGLTQKGISNSTLLKLRDNLFVYG